METEATPPSMRETAYRTLRRLLVLQKIPEGERLREPQWAERLGVNRTALREAFARLEAEGLIEHGERTGYFVPVLKREDISEIFFVRTVLECAAIELICTAPKHALTASKSLHGLCDEFEQFAGSHYSLGTSEADRRFHECLMNAGRNKRLEMLYNRAPLPLIHSKIVSDRQWTDQTNLVAAEHRGIADAIGHADAKLAKRRLKAHLGARHVLAITA